MPKRNQKNETLTIAAIVIVVSASVASGLLLPVVIGNLAIAPLIDDRLAPADLDLYARQPT